MASFDLLTTPPHVTLGNFYPFAPGESAGPHWSESNLFLPVTSGKGEIDVGTQRFALTQGQVLHVPWATPVHYHADARDPFVVIGLHFKYLPWTDKATPPLHSSMKVDARRRAMQTPPVPQPFDDAFVFTPPPAQSRIFDTAIAIAKTFEHDRLRKTDSDCEARLRALALEFLILVRDHRRSARPLAAHPQSGVVAELMSFLDLSYRHPWKRADLAERAGISESSLASAFRAVTGKSPIDYLIDLRLAHARTLLSTSRQRVSEVAEQAGIPDVYYFSKLFKRRHGLSPLQYRQQRRL